MKSLGEVINNTYHNNNYRLEKNFNDAMKNNNFKKICDSLNLPNKELMKYTSKLESSACEIDNCSKCKNILECTNEVKGYVFYPVIESDNLVFDYLPCKKKKELDKKNYYKDNIYLFDMPKEILNACMKDIKLDDENRFATIKWIKEYLEKYKNNENSKGLYLTGNFGCGKTYLLSAMFNELAKNGEKVAIIYYPELLRKLKESFVNDYEVDFDRIKKVKYLLLDDIGAETTTSWARDEVLGTILQYRMDEGLDTFFTSNLTLKELEEHLSISSKGVEKVKARRIIERIKYLTYELSMVGENKRK